VKGFFWRFVLISVCIVIRHGVSYADEEVPFKYKSYTSIGGNISSISGLGWSIGYHFSSPVLIRASGFIQSNEDETYSAFGIEVQYDLSKGQVARFYLVGGTGLYGTSDNTSDTTNTTKFALGIGMGGEIALGFEFVNHLSIGAQIYPEALYVNKTDSAVSVGGSLYFCFNW